MKRIYCVPHAAKKLPKGTSGPQRTGGNSREPYVSDRQPQQQSVSLRSIASFLVSSSCVNYKENSLVNDGGHHFSSK